MSDYAVFPNAPITEALIDIRVEIPKEVDLKRLQSYHEFIKNRFTVKQESKIFQSHVKISNESESTSSSETIGYLFRSPGENKVVQARLDGYTFNKLKPYENWEKFSSEAQMLWNHYFQLVQPVRILRIGLRYINKIPIPLPFTDFKEYILTVPEIAPNLPQELAHFFMRLVIPNDQIFADAIIILTTEKRSSDQKLPLIFDIEVIKEVNYKGNSLEIWDEFKKLHRFKNDIFFNSITEKTKELFV